MKARESGNDVREAMHAASEKYTAILKGVLTPDQFQQWQDARKKMMERMQQMQQSQGDQPAPPQN